MYVHRKTDQTYNTMLKLIVESRENFQDKAIHLKLFRRFWKCLMTYRDDADSAYAIFFYRQQFLQNPSGVVKNVLFNLQPNN
jgi:hypothetical protein